MLHLAIKAQQAALLESHSFLYGINIERSGSCFAAICDLLSEVYCLIAVGGGIKSKTEVQIAILPDKFRLFYDNIASVVQNHCKRLLFLLFLFFHHDVLAVRQHLIELAILRGLELTVVDLYAVIEIKLDTGKCQMADLLIVFPAFLQLLGEFILTLGAAATSRAFSL